MEVSKKLLIILISLSILYYKPLYSIIFILAFCVEYFYFIDFVVNIYKNYDNYHRISVKEVDISEMKISDTWFEYCKLVAFQKLYMMLMRNKKISIWNIVVVLIVWVFGIPLKFLRLCKYFLISEYDLKRTMLNLYFTLYSKLKGSKIEVLSGKIYLNCYTTGKLCKKLLENNHLITEKNFMEGIKILRSESLRFSKFEGEHFETRLISAKDDKGKEIFSLHYGIIENNSTLHGTSNIPRTLPNNQRLDIPMPSLILPKAKNPGTIITERVNNIFVSNKSKLVPKIEIDSIKYGHPELFSQSKDVYEYIRDKDMTYQKVLQEYFYYGGKTNSALVKELKTNIYNQTLIYAEETDFMEGYKNFYKEFKE